MNRIQSKDHRIANYEINKILLSCFDDKIYIYKTMDVMDQLFVVKFPYKRMCKHVVKKLPFVIRSFPDQYKAQKMCDEAINTHLSTMEFVPDYYKTQEICDKQMLSCIYLCS